MIEKAYLGDYKYRDWNEDPNHSLSTKQAPAHKRWRFRPRSFWPFLLWGLSLFLGFRIIIIPLTEGVYNLFTKSQEIGELELQYQAKLKQISLMEKTRDYMITPSYVEERGHQIGLIKSNEAQMVVVEPGGAELKSKIFSKTQKKLEIGD